MLRLRLLVLTMIASNYCIGMELETGLGEVAINPKTTRPCIYLLNGTTTSGKSSITLELEKKLERGKKESSLKVLTLDTFFGSHIPLSFLWSITPTQMDEARKKAHRDLCLEAKAAYDKKLDVIIDAVVYKPEDVKLYKDELKNYLVKWILIYCPVDTLAQRVIQRNENSGATEQRSVLQALDQFSHFYQKKNSLHAIDMLSPHTIVETCTTARKQHAIMQEKNWWFVNNIQNAICPSDCSTIQRSLLENLTPDGGNTKTGIGPVEPHDLCVNTKWDDSALCADAILAFFNK